MPRRGTNGFLRQFVRSANSWLCGIGKEIVAVLTRTVVVDSGRVGILAEGTAHRQKGKLRKNRADPMILAGKFFLLYISALPEGNVHFDRFLPHFSSTYRSDTPSSAFVETDSNWNIPILIKLYSRTRIYTIINPGAIVKTNH